MTDAPGPSAQPGQLAELSPGELAALVAQLDRIEHAVDSLVAVQAALVESFGTKLPLRARLALRHAMRGTGDDPDSRPDHPAHP